MTQQEFELCIQQILDGDQDGLRKIYESYSGYIYSIVYGVLSNRENAEDVTSEFFIRLWKRAATYQSGNAHRAWIAMIAKNMAIDFIRKHRREIPTEEGMELLDSPDNIEKEVLGNMSVMEALETLNENERRVVDMKILGEMTFQEISDTLGIPMGTVTWRYQNAIKKLRRCGYE